MLLTEDETFAREAGVELLVETARLWRSLGYDDAAGRFRIDGVTGPDEYSAIADNNVYTNLMAARNLRAAADALESHPELARPLGVDDEEAAGWRSAAEAIFIPYDESLGVHPQAEGFTEAREWDFDSTPSENYPLLLHYPYFDLYRKQVVKQADLVMALFYAGEYFTPEEKARNFAFYERLTVRDSSLSACIQAPSRPRWVTSSSPTTTSPKPPYSTSTTSSTTSATGSTSPRSQEPAPSRSRASEACATATESSASCPASRRPSLAWRSTSAPARQRG